VSFNKTLANGPDPGPTSGPLDVNQNGFFAPGVPSILFVAGVAGGGLPISVRVWVHFSAVPPPVVGLPGAGVPMTGVPSAPGWLDAGLFELGPGIRVGGVGGGSVFAGGSVRYAHRPVLDSITGRPLEYGDPTLATARSAKLISGPEIATPPPSLVDSTPIGTAIVDGFYAQLVAEAAPGGVYLLLWVAA
jgi:hypothetical protein